MKNVLTTTQAVSITVVLFCIALTVGSIAYESGWLFATAAGVAFLFFVLVSIAEWFYDKGTESE